MTIAKMYIAALFCACFSTARSEINVYFSHSVDTTLADPIKANGFVLLDDKLVDRINDAQHSIDFCFYNIWRWGISDALIGAHNQGISVRVITEHDHIDNLAVQNLINAGIHVIDDTYGINTGDGFMHNKFAVFDFRDSVSAIDDWTWTGSYNATDYGTESNANNVIEIQHRELARAYTIEFEEMWGSSGDQPNPDSSRFQMLKTDNTNHSFMVDSIPMYLYFSPSDHSTPRMINAVSASDSTIYFCIFAYTRQDLCDAMKDRWNAGISVKGVFDEVDWLGYYSKSRDMTGDPSSSNPWSPPAPVFPDSVHSPWGTELLHHKYLIVDSDGGHAPVVITGCQNWSNSGEYYNDENTLIIENAAIANQYLQEFAERYREAGGQYVAIGEQDRNREVDFDRLELTAQPNPFTSTATISLQGLSDHQSTRIPELKIYDASGRLVRTLFYPMCRAPCSTQVTWDGRNKTGNAVRPGIYFAVHDHTVTLKLIKIK
jgi:phosphatidylserine/phosphatidylglycerophosphate/cardiolipin synthase-like enzyme